MMRRVVMVVLLAVLAGASVDAQARRRPARAAPRPATKTEPADITCPAVLGAGVRTKRTFCDVLTGRDPLAGILIKLPPHTGDVTLTFDLHNRQTYSEEQVRMGRAYARYTATIGVLTMDNTLVTRAVVSSEFRGPADLVDRVAGGAGPGGVKAVAPTGTEPIVVKIPAREDQVSILGERLAVERIDGQEAFGSPGRPIAVISNVMVEYRPAPVKRKR